MSVQQSAGVPQVIGVIGTGVMGRGIVQLHAQGGFNVVMFDANRQSAQAAYDFIAGMLRRAAAKGGMDAQAAEAAIARITIADDLSAMAACGVVVEAVAEKLEVKKDLFTQLEGIVADDCILASNTSSLLVTAVAAACRLPGRVAGYHFFNPVPLMPVVEVIPGERTDPSVTTILCRLAEACGHKAVLCQDSPGFVINHAGRGMYSEGLRLVQEGVADPVTIDRVVREAGGFKMGPFELMDLTGLDVSYPVMELIYHQFFQEPRFRPSPLPSRRVAAGLFGRKSGEGFYVYPEGKQQQPPEAPVPSVALPKVWVSRAEADLAPAVAELFAQAGCVMDLGERPDADSLCVVTPLGSDAGSAALQQGVDPRRTVAVDPLFLNKRVTLMLTTLTEPAWRDAAHAALAASGRAVAVINDSVGFVAQRVVATIVNIGCDIAQQRIAAPADVDDLVRLGLGYPAGPLSLGDRVGARHVLKVLEGMQAFYGDPRYRPSPWLKRRAALGVSLRVAEAERQ
ncbi:MAG: 3-hydroxyacyl-CoA dehydrogenase [Magnetospirillum sp.]